MQTPRLHRKSSNSLTCHCTGPTYKHVTSTLLSSGDSRRTTIPSLICGYRPGPGGPTGLHVLMTTDLKYLRHHWKLPGHWSSVSIRSFLWLESELIYGVQHVAHFCKWLHARGLAAEFIFSVRTVASPGALGRVFFKVTKTLLTTGKRLTWHPMSQKLATIHNAPGPLILSHTAPPRELAAPTSYLSACPPSQHLNLMPLPPALLRLEASITGQPVAPAGPLGKLEKSTFRGRIFFFFLIRP